MAGSSKAGSGPTGDQGQVSARRKCKFGRDATNSNYKYNQIFTLLGYYEKRIQSFVDQRHRAGS